MPHGLSKNLDLDFQVEDEERLRLKITELFNLLKDGKQTDLSDLGLHLFDLIESLTNALFLMLEKRDVIDVTELRHFMNRMKLHRTNPPLFKRINDIAWQSDFKVTWT